MKLALVLLSLSLSIFASVAHADNVAACTSLSGTNRAFSLLIVNQNVMQIRFRVNSHRFRYMHPTIKPEQNVEGVTVYTITGMSSDLEVENQILEGNNGLARLSNEEFSCQ